MKRSLFLMSSSGRWQKLFFLTGFDGFDGSDFASVTLSATLLNVGSGGIDAVDDADEAIDANDIVEVAPAVSRDVVLADVSHREIVLMEAAPSDVALSEVAPSKERASEAVTNSPISPASRTISSCDLSLSSKAGSGLADFPVSSSMNETRRDAADPSECDADGFRPFDVMRTD